MSLTLLKQFIRILHVAYIAALFVWVYQNTPNSTHPLVIAIFQTFPLILITPIFVHFKPQLLHLALPIIMIYLCFTAPNLFLPWPQSQVAWIELALNLTLSSLIMWYQLKASKLKRSSNAQTETYNNSSTE